MKHALALLSCLAAAPGLASPPENVVQGDVLTGWRMADGQHVAALRLQLAPRWKTYWRAPGEAGIPPVFDWTGSENLGKVIFHWPNPSVFRQNGMQTIGYHDGLVLPFTVAPLDPTQPVVLRLGVDMGVCLEICVPAQLDFVASLPPQGSPDPLIDIALADRPATAAEGGVTKITCQVEPLSDGLRVTARLAMPPTGAREAVAMEPAGNGIWVSEAIITRTANDLTATVDMVPANAAPFVLDLAQLTVTVLGDDRNVEIVGCPAE